MNMSVEEDNNYVSVGSWMWMMFVTAIPVIGVIMILVWAFTGDNESRKNYYKAILMWVVILVGLVVALALLGNLSGLQKQFSTWTHKV
jgi:phosphoglycerol transferase MdoB-like AlkP superfamily enzyme